MDLFLRKCQLEYNLVHSIFLDRFIELFDGNIDNYNAIISRVIIHTKMCTILK